MKTKLTNQMRNNMTVSTEEYNKLLNENKRLKKQKSYGLVWDEKLNQEDVKILKGQMPILKEVTKNNIDGTSHGTNILIEGDNYDALSILNYTHGRQVDMIYIDPPYNTGNTLIYNNNYVDRDDLYIHSKFLSFLYKRLKIAKTVLKKDGVICCTIDDYELLSVLGILDKLDAQILSIVIIVIKPEGRAQDDHVRGSHEYAIFATWGKPTSRKILPRVEPKQTYEEISKQGRHYRWDTFYRRGDKKDKPEKESRWYPIYVHKKTMKISYSKKKDWAEVYPVDTLGTKWIWDMTPHDFSKLIKDMDDEDPEIIAKQNKNTQQITIHRRRYQKKYSKPLSYWHHEDYSPQTYGSKLIPRIINKQVKFDYPKSLLAVYDCIDVFLPEDGILLDFFAGSGTAGHATLLLNLRDQDLEQTFIKKYGKNYHKDKIFLDNDAIMYLPYEIKSNRKGRETAPPPPELCRWWSWWRKNHAKRRFVLCTNNEIKKEISDKLKKEKAWISKKESDHPEGICKKITYPRLKGISEGYEWNQKQAEKLVHPLSSQGSIIPYSKTLTNRIPRIPFRLKHFKVELFEWKSTIKCKIDFSKRATELLCLKEYCFESIRVKDRTKFQIYKDHDDRHMGIIFHPDYIKIFEKRVKELKLESINTYVFSINGATDKSHFTENSDKINLKPIPTAIIEMYRKIVRDL